MEDNAPVAGGCKRICGRGGGGDHTRTASARLCAFIVVSAAVCDDACGHGARCTATHRRSACGIDWDQHGISTVDETRVRERDRDNVRWSHVDTLILSADCAAQTRRRPACC
jgi:hypothetical protein